MKNLLCALLPISAAILSSCSDVHTQTPVANETEISLQEEFVGSWKLYEGILHVAFDEDGFGRFASTYWEDNEFETAHGKFNALRSEKDQEMGFISIQVEEDDPEDRTYQFCAFKLVESGEILIWQTNSIRDYEPFLSDNKMVGEIERNKFGDSILFMDGAELATKTEKFGKYFNLKDPIVLTRVLPKKEPEPKEDDDVEK